MWEGLHFNPVINPEPRRIFSQRFLLDPIVYFTWKHQQSVTQPGPFLSAGKSALERDKEITFFTIADFGTF